MCCREIFVVQSPYIFYMQQLKDVVNTGNKLHVWTLGVHDIAALWELPQFRVIDILRQHGVVLVGKVTPQALHTYVFSPLQLLEQWYTVEDFSMTVSVRYCRKAAAIDSTHFRVMFMGEIYNIVNIDHMNFRKKSLKFTCRKERR